MKFLVRTNIDSDFAEINKIASGGEKSRLALLLKSLNNINNILLVFDEIDSGTSGEVTGMIGKKLYFLSRNTQVICITHQPLLACFADSHFLVKKSQIDEKTRLEIKKLEDQEDKLEALLDLMTGEKYQKKNNNNNIQDARNLALKYAESLFNNAKKFKHEIK